MLKRVQVLVILFLLSNLLFAQQEKTAQVNTGLIQFSGIIVESDSLQAIPFSSVIVKHTQRGTISDFFGYFSFVAQKSDTIIFSAIGFKTAQYIIPDSLPAGSYSLIQVLHKDTILLQAIEIYPWPSKEEFKHAFLDLDLSNADYIYGNVNRVAAANQMVEMAMDASASYKITNSQNQSKLYYSGQYPSINVLNPIAWAKFIKAWKEGLLKN